MNCIDVSEWNSEIDGKAAKAAGVDYALIRCGFGQRGIDKYFNINLEEAAAAGVIIGVYFYSYATDYDSACAEAKHCIELIEDYKDIILLPVFYDVEEDRNVARITDVCMGFINTLNYYGYNCGIYTMIGWYDQFFKPISTDYIWLASWGPDDGEPHKAPEYCDIWQYTSKGSVDGVGSRCVDCDILNNKDMRLLINQEPEPVPQEVNIDITVKEPEGVKVNVRVYRV